MKIRMFLLMVTALLLAFAGSSALPAATAAPETPAAVSAAFLPRVTTVVEQATASAASFGVERVLCPEGLVAIGGGVDVNNVLTMQVSSSAPVFPDGPGGSRLISQANGAGPAPIGWQASAVNTTASEQSFSVAVICADLPDVSTVVSFSTADAGNFTLERVLCPDNTVAVGGGADANNVLTMQLSSSAPVFPDGAGGTRLLVQADGASPAPIGWQATAVVESGTAQQMKVAAICVDLPDVSTMVGSATASAGSFAVERVLCPEGMVAIGGGVDVDNVLNMEASSSAPTFPGDSGNRLIQQSPGTYAGPVGWQSSAVVNSGTDEMVKVAAICAPAPDLTFLPIIIK